jgi:hypothetical protein
MCSERNSQNAFELRLEGGISFGFGPPRPGDGGMAQILRAPGFCRDPELAHYFKERREGPVGTLADRHDPHVRRSRMRRASRGRSTSITSLRVSVPSR